MKYNLANKQEKSDAFSYFMKLANKKSLIEVKKINPVRTINQNNYLHLIIGYFGLHFGYTIEEAKAIYKEINSGIYAYTKKGRTFYRSSTDLTVDEMSQTIDTFRQKSKEQGCELPLATNSEWLRSIENSIEQSGYYLRGNT